jgi:hypothetical protein
MREDSLFGQSKSQTVIVLSGLDNIGERSLRSLLFRSQKEKLAIVIPDGGELSEVLKDHT